MEIDEDDPEFESCLCDIDSSGCGPQFHPGDRVYVMPLGLEGTIIRQTKHYDGPESFWGNVEIRYDDGVFGISNSWQVRKI